MDPGLYEATPHRTGSDVDYLQVRRSKVDGKSRGLANVAVGVGLRS